MTEAVSNMSPLEAARAIQETKQWDSVLRQRTEGLTWMLWGIVAGAMFLSYEFAAREHAPGWAMGVLWIPWVVLGNVFNVILWRTAAVARPTLTVQRSWRSFVRLILTFVAVYLLEFFVVHPDSWVAPMFFAAVAWSAMGVLIPNMSTRGKRVSLIIGLVTLACALILAYLRPSEPVGGILASVCIGLTAFCGGLAHATLG